MTNLRRSYDEITIINRPCAIFRKILWRFYDLKLWQSCDHK